MSEAGPLVSVSSLRRRLSQARRDQYAADRGANLFPVIGRSSRFCAVSDRKGYKRRIPGRGSAGSAPDRDFRRSARMAPRPGASRAAGPSGFSCAPDHADGGNQHAGAREAADQIADPSGPRRGEPVQDGARDDRPGDPYGDVHECRQIADPVPVR